MSNLPIPVPVTERIPRWIHRFLARQAGAAIDLSLLRLMMGPDRIPTAAEIREVAANIERTHRYYLGRGFIDDPARFHPEPELPATVEIRNGWHPLTSYERVSFPSEYVPDAYAAQRERWWSYRENRTAHALVMRHRGDRPRPWLICLHGLGTGEPWMDLPAFRAVQLYRRLGLNLIMPVMPLHGVRRAPGMDRGALVSFRLMDTIHGLGQAVWDTRRFIRWARAQGAERFGLFGLSLGAYAASLVAGLEENELALAGIPVADIPALFDGHTPDELSATPMAEVIPGERLRQVLSVVSPHALPPRTPPDRRFIFAGVADRISPPLQAEILADAWGRPPIGWFDGGHVSFFWSKEVGRFVDDVMWRTGFAVR